MHDFINLSKSLDIDDASALYFTEYLSAVVSDVRLSFIFYKSYNEPDFLSEVIKKFGMKEFKFSLSVSVSKLFMQ